MQTRLVLLGAACLLTTSAVAADMPIYSEPIYSAPAAYDWTGFYAGINGGYGGGVFKHPFQLIGPEEEDVIPVEGAQALLFFEDAEFPEPGEGEEILATGTADVTAGGFVAGVQAGYNWQYNDNILIGLEGDIQGSTIDGRVSVSITDSTGAIIPEGESLDADLGTKLDWFATIRPRIGWVNDRFVVYATGGLAWGQTTSSINATIAGEPLIDESITNDRFGWTAGAGIEYALTDNITFKTEYLYTDLGAVEIVNLSGEEFNFAMHSDVKFHTVRAGLNFQF